jgi:hypothetical protein
MALSSSHYLVHLLPEYRHHLDVSLPPEDNLKFLACCILSENLPHFDFGECPQHPREMNTPTILSGSIADLTQVSMEAKQFVHLYQSTDQETFDSVN